MKKNIQLNAYLLIIIISIVTLSSGIYIWMFNHQKVSLEPTFSEDIAKRLASIKTTGFLMSYIHFDGLGYLGGSLFLLFTNGSVSFYNILPVKNGTLTGKFEIVREESKNNTLGIMKGKEDFNLTKFGEITGAEGGFVIIYGNSTNLTANEFELVNTLIRNANWFYNYLYFYPAEVIDRGLRYITLVDNSRNYSKTVGDSYSAPEEFNLIANFTYHIISSRGWS